MYRIAAENENRSLSGRVEELERRLRRRTITLGTALAFSGLTAIAVILALAVVPPRDEPRAPMWLGEIPKERLAVGRAGDRAGAGTERPERSPEVARQGGIAITVAQNPDAPKGAEQAEQRATTGRAADTEGEAPRAALATKEHVGGLDAARAQHGGAVAAPHARPENIQAEARPPGERLAASRRELEQPDAVLAAMAAWRAAVEEGYGADPRGTGTEAGGAVPAGATARSLSPGAEGDGARVSEAIYYAAAHPVNLRAAPSNAAEVLAVVEQGNVVRGIGRDRGWLQVDYTDRRVGERTGWVHGSHLRRVEAPSQGNGPSINPLGAVTANPVVEVNYIHHRAPRHPAASAAPLAARTREEGLGSARNDASPPIDAGVHTPSSVPTAGRAGSQPPNGFATARTPTASTDKLLEHLRAVGSAAELAARDTRPEAPPGGTGATDEQTRSRALTGSDSLPRGPLAITSDGELRAIVERSNLGRP